MSGKVIDFVKALWGLDLDDEITIRVLKYKEKGPDKQSNYRFIIKTNNGGFYDKEIFKAFFTENVIEEVEGNGAYKDKTIFKE